MIPMVIVILALSVILAVVLLVAAIVSFVELRLEEQALDAHREMLRTYYGQQKSRK